MPFLLEKLTNVRDNGSMTEPLRQGRLLVVEYLPGSRREKSCYRCICDCGTIYIIPCSDFRKGRQKSCGCLRRERMETLTKTHGMSRTAEYRAWHAMITRCETPSATNYSSYGGRGIKVCERWRQDFVAFYADMGPRPSQNHSVDRIESNGDYEPSNCRWSTTYTQSRNRRSTRLLTAFGKTQSVSDWANERGIGIPCLFARLRKGIPIEDALTIPLNDYAALRHAVPTTKP